MSTVAYEDRLAARPAEVYADFLLPYLDSHTHLLDLGCGDGALSIGLASSCAHVTAVDLDADELGLGASYATAQGLDRITFEQGDATKLDHPDASFDAVLAHSVLESGADPAALLAEAHRVLVPGGWLGVASVEYGGLILAGPDVTLLRRSNEVRERLWRLAGADPFLGRELRRVVIEAGFDAVEATTKAFSYGTTDLVRAFAAGRGGECADADYVADAVEAGLATPAELAQMADAWSAWGESPAAYASFTWCRAVGRKPLDDQGPR